MPTLIVLRHSKAASPLGTRDFERPLADRGLRDSTRVGDELRGKQWVPQQVICSTALRTRQTLDGLSIAAPAEFEQRVYQGDADDLLELLNEQGREDMLLLVGHNPSVHQLVLDLTGAEVRSFPTSAAAVIEFDGDWADLGPGGGRLVELWTPNG